MVFQSPSPCFVSQMLSDPSSRDFDINTHTQTLLTAATSRHHGEYEVALNNNVTAQCLKFVIGVPLIAGLRLLLAFVKCPSGGGCRWPKRYCKGHKLAILNDLFKGVVPLNYSTKNVAVRAAFAFCRLFAFLPLAPTKLS